MTKTYLVLEFGRCVRQNIRMTLCRHQKAPRTFFIKFILFFILTVISVEVYTARPSQPTKKDIVISEKCSAAFIEWLGVSASDMKKGLEFPMANGEWTPEGLKTFSSTNHATLSAENPKLVSFGPHWWDLSAAIPRSQGPRFLFQSPQVESLEAFPKSWSQILERFKKEPALSGRPWGAGKILYEKVPCSDKSFGLTIVVVESPDGETITGASGTPGAPRNRYSAMIRAGEIIEAIHSNGLQ